MKRCWVWVNEAPPPPPLTAPKTVAHPSGSHIGWRQPPWDERAAYVETTFRDITGPMHLVEWCDSSPSSALKDYVLFLITMVMRTGSVERFFSFAKYTDTDQRHGVDDNGCRQAFMTHYNGDLEGRLD